MDGNGEQRLRGSRSKQRLLYLGLAAAVVMICVAFRYYNGADVAAAKPPLSGLFSRSTSDPKPALTGNGTPAVKGAPPVAEAPKPEVVAVVNSEAISRDELGRECLRQYGNEVLESLVNKHLIAEHCKKHGVVVTQQEIDGEIDRMARKFSLPKDQWLKMLQKERGIKPAQYGNDIIWPTLALRKLAANQLTVSREELEKGYESQFGLAVKARLIVLKSPDEAKWVRSQALAKPEDFGVLAKKHSKDVNSASANGLIQPIRRHLGDPKLEQVAFSLKPGEISQVVPVGNLYAILKCEGFIEPTKADRAQVDPLLADAIRDRKLRSAANDIFKQIQQGSKVENVYNDPAKSQRMPGVAAMINDHKIQVRELADESLERHGVEVLEQMVDRRLLEQAMRKRNIAVTREEIDAEIGRAAVSMGKTTPTGKPDVDAWLKTVTKDRHLSLDLYVNAEVWPSVALKKLVGNGVKISDDDMKKGYDANYGPRVRCRAIVLSNQRKAQEVWEKARENLTVKHFGDLAEKYSAEANSRQMRGEVPPIQRHGGQPLLEKEAFSLKPGELSGVIQVGENFVILLCEGYTKPTPVNFAEVRQVLYEDLLEKKQRIAMAKQFEQIKDAAHIDNYLAGTIKSPKKAGKEEDSIDKLLEQPLEAHRPGSAAPKRR